MRHDRRRSARQRDGRRAARVGPGARGVAERARRRQVQPARRSFGHPGVWSFYETPIAPERPAAPPAALARWLDLAAGPWPREQVATAAAEVARAFNTVSDGRPEAAAAPDLEADKALSDPKGPFWSDARRDDKNLPAPARAGDEAPRGALSLQKKATEAVPYAHGLQEGGTPQTVYEGFHDARVLRPRPVRPSRRSGPAPLPAPARRRRPAADHPGERPARVGRWIASADNPLTARVMVNRIWQHHFGQGIVRTPNNFGKLGDAADSPGVARLAGRSSSCEYGLVDQGDAPADHALRRVPAVEQCPSRRRSGPTRTTSCSAA